MKYDIDNINWSGKTKAQLGTLILDLLQQRNALSQRRAQTITDNAMEVRRLHELLDVEKKSVEHWKNYAHDQERIRQNLSNELQKTVGKSHNQEQIIRKLGDSLALAGEAIAHL